MPPSASRPVASAPLQVQPGEALRTQQDDGAAFERTRERRRTRVWCGLVPPRHVVSAVVVSHNGERWLGELIAGLRQQTRPVDRVLCVDTGSTDASAEMLARGFSPKAVLSADDKTGFGAAVTQALRHLPPVAPPSGRPEAEPEVVEWLWLLHDDCAPTPGALREMLALLQEVPAAAAVGPKIRGWPRGRQLLELGVTISGSGKRETGLEYGEFDQGQHDVVREALSVSSAGMLVRREVFERLGGFDPSLPLFRDDVDFGWRLHRAGYHVITCPDAIVFHAEAGARGARALPAVKNVRPRQADRRAANHVQLANCALWALPWVALRTVLGALLRTIGLLIAKWPDAAYDEFVAMARTVARPDRVMRARMRRTRGRRVPRRKFRHLFPPPWVGLQHAWETLTGVLSTSSDAGSHAGSRKRRKAVETGPVSEEAEELEGTGPGWIGRSIGRPPVLLVGGLILVALLAGRELLTGGALLSGGGLLPAPDGAGELWSRYLEGWHSVELGSPRAAPPYLAVVAFLGTILLGKVGVAVVVLLLGAVPLSGLTAYLLARKLLATRVLRLWAAGMYALIPAVTGAVAGGHLGSCVAVMLAPLLVLALGRLFRNGSWSATWTSALLLGIITAFVPLAFVIALLAGLVAAFTWRPRRRTATRLAVVLITAPMLLLPWLPTLLANPTLLFAEAGRIAPELADPAPAGYELALGSPGGPAAAPFWLLLGLPLVALAALLRRDRVRGTIAVWAVAGIALILGVLQLRLPIDAEWLPYPMPAWPGFAAAMMLGCWVAAVVWSADGISQVFASKSFSWRQPAAAVLATVAGITPVLALGWYVWQSTDGSLLRRTEAAVPEYISGASRSDGQPRALVLHTGEESIRYTLLRGEAPRLGDAETGSSRQVLEELEGTVSEVLGDGNPEGAADRLADFGIGFVYLPDATESAITQRLDATPGLVRASAPQSAASWSVERPVATVTVRTDSEVIELGAPPRVRVPANADGTVVLAEAYHQGWRATLDGRELKGTAVDGWAQGFQLPEGGGVLRVEFDPGPAGRLLPLQGVLTLLVVLLAVPSRARREDGPVYAEAVRGGKHGMTAEMLVEAPPEPDRTNRTTPISDRIPQEARR